MKPFLKNIEKLTLKNTAFRKVIYTAPKLQLVLMSLKPGQEIGEEVHSVDQFIRFEAGKGKVLLDDRIYEVREGDALLIPKGTLHNVVNTGLTYLKLYTIYSSPIH